MWVLCERKRKVGFVELLKINGIIFIVVIFKNECNM